MHDFQIQYLNECRSLSSFFLSKRKLFISYSRFFIHSHLSEHTISWSCFYRRLLFAFLFFVCRNWNSLPQTILGSFYLLFNICDRFFFFNFWISFYFCFFFFVKFFLFFLPSVGFVEKRNIILVIHYNLNCSLKSLDSFCGCCCNTIVRLFRISESDVIQLKSLKKCFIQMSMHHCATVSDTKWIEESV